MRRAEVIDPPDSADPSIDGSWSLGTRWNPQARSARRSGRHDVHAALQLDQRGRPVQGTRVAAGQCRRGRKPAGALMSRPLLILGTGGSAHDVLDVVEAINAVAPTWGVAGFLDDNRPPGTRHLGLEVFGP